MGHETSEDESADDGEHAGGTSLGLALPVREPDLFKHGATAHVLNFLADNPDINVSIRQLATVTPMSERSTREAVDVLEANELVESTHTGNARRVHINRARLDKPADPIRSIPQTSYQTPVRVACRYIREALEDVVGIVLFGSVARGEADRQSDVDLWVLVGDDVVQQRHEANKLTKRLGDLQIPPTVAMADARNADFERNWGDIKDVLENDAQDWASAERHSFEIVVESPQSILNQRERVNAEELFGEGITLRSSDVLERVKVEVLGDE